jgi:cell division protein FtsZ
MSGTAISGNKDIASDAAVACDPRIAVVGVGGAGCRIASALYGRGVRADVIAVNTDKAALEQTSADSRIYICKAVTQGLGTRGDAELGKKCAQIHEAEIMSAISGHDLVVIVAGMGGGTGTGAAPVIAELCDRIGVTTAAVAVMPFSFESGRAFKAAEGYRKLHALCRHVIKMNNDRALDMGFGTMDEAIRAVNSSVVRLVENFIADAAVMRKTYLASKAGREQGRSGRDMPPAEMQPGAALKSS